MVIGYAAIELVVALVIIAAFYGLIRSIHQSIWAGKSESSTEAVTSKPENLVESANRWVRTIAVVVFVLSLVPWFPGDLFLGLGMAAPNAQVSGLGNLFLLLFTAYPFYSGAAFVLA